MTCSGLATTAFAVFPQRIYLCVAGWRFFVPLSHKLLQPLTHHIPASLISGQPFSLYRLSPPSGPRSLSLPSHHIPAALTLLPAFLTSLPTPLMSPPSVFFLLIPFRCLGASTSRTGLWGRPPIPWRRRLTPSSSSAVSLTSDPGRRLAASNRNRIDRDCVHSSGICFFGSSVYVRRGVL